MIAQPGISLADGMDEGLNFVPLFNGKDLGGWVLVNVAPNTFTVKDGVIHSTGVPTGISLASLRTAAFGMRMQPCETRPGRICGSFVPWIPMNPPPGQSVRAFERALSPIARGPYAGAS